MGRSHVDERVDLLSLPEGERLRFCREIHAALKRKVAEAKLPVADDVVVVDESILDGSASCDLGVSRESRMPVDSPQKASTLNSLLKRIW